MATIEVDFIVEVSGDEMVYDTFSSEDGTLYLDNNQQMLWFVDSDYPDLRIHVPYSNVSAIREFTD